MADLLSLAILSDTHDDLEGVYPRLGDVEAVVHAGDISSARTLETMRGWGLPLYAVLGNTDWGSHAQDLGETLVTEIGGLRLFVRHILRGRSIPQSAESLPPRLREELLEHDPDVVVYGHTHIRHALRIDDRLFLNPGSVTQSRDSQPRGFMRLHAHRDPEAPRGWDFTLETVSL